MLATDLLIHDTGDDTVDLPVKIRAGEEAGDNLETTDNDDTDDTANLGSSLDDYYSRTHIPATKRPLLIVGGSDGSGTRAFVDTLGRLGVPMLVDDAGTLDIHASSLFDGKGWPPLVELVMNITGSANYEFEDLPGNVQEQALAELKKLRDQYDGRAMELLAKGKVENKRVSNKVEYGFKAPVSMLLLPLLREVYGSIKFLHVVRDGRDVALSKNQSPVKKFYDLYYEDSTDRRKLYDNDNLKEAMGVQLWNDWNVETLEWEQHHSDGDSFDYLVMRAEDLLDPIKKFDSLVQLADFVGSQKTTNELCCMSQQALVDMGQSGHPGTRTGLPNILEQGSSYLSALKGKALEERSERKPEDRNTLRDQAHALHHVERGTQPSGRDVRDKRKAKLNRLVAEREVGNNRRLFGEQTLEIRKPRRSYFTEKKAQKVEEEQEDKDLMLETSPRSSRTKKLQLDKVFTKGFGTQVSSHRLSKQLRQESPEDVKKRYGKWVSALEGRPDLSALLHSQGASALETFGYEPSATFMDQRIDRKFQCDASVICSQ